MTLGLLEPLDDQLRLNIATFFAVPDLGRYACSSRWASEDASVDFVWGSIFNSTRRPSGSLSQEVKAQVARPYGKDAVGFHVSVFYPELNTCLSGIVKEYRSTTNEYLVQYSAPRPSDNVREAWELEARTDSAVRSNPTLASRSRISFLQPPASAAANVPTEEAEACCAAPSASVPGSERPLRFPTWREELKHVASHTPSKILTRLQDHSDEVLFASFSCDGRRLATCSRDCTTCIYEFDQDGLPALSAVLQHSSAAAHVHWCPDPEYNYIAISTDGPTRPMAEVWDIDKRECILRVLSPVRDVYASIVRWPAGGLALVASGILSVRDEYTQELCVYGLPPHAHGQVSPQQLMRGGSGERLTSGTPMARLILRGAMNYFHCPEDAAAAGGPEGRFVALSGTGPRQCDSVSLIDLPSEEDIRRVGEGSGGRPLGAVFELRPQTRELHSHAVLSARWAQGGSLLLVNARPRVDGCWDRPSRGETMAQAVRRPAPPLRTAFELLVLDAVTLDTLSVHGGHHAFTTAEAPFIVHADAWADSDIVASGGEDTCIHVWHRSHGNQLARLQAHTQAVNAVTWSNKLRLMVSASDDHTAVVWSCGAATPTA